MDRRVQKTRVALVDALVDLVHERGFDEMRLEELLRSADVGRSTFYEHYKNKDHFLVASFVNMLDMADKAEIAHYGDALPFVLPSAPVLRHIHEFAVFAVKIAQSAVFEEKMQAGEAKLREIAAARIGKLYPEMDARGRTQASVFIASAFTGMLRWWMQRGVKENWEELDASFKAMVESGLTARALR